MHNLQKIKIFRLLLAITYPIALIFILPIILLIKRKKEKFFFFFDRYSIGGAQRVHIDVLNSIKEEPKLLYFTRKSPNGILKDLFYSLDNVQCKDIHFWCDNLLIRLFTVHYFAFLLNKHKGITVFSSNSTFFYDLLPFIKKKGIKRIELLHNFSYGKRGMEFFGLANYKFLDSRIVIDTFTLKNIEEQYKSYSIPLAYLERVNYIETGVDIPPFLHKDFNNKLKVLYAGRGGIQKRVHLINEIANFFIQNKLPVEFHFAGPVIDELSDEVKSNAIIHGQVKNLEIMNEIYATCHAILMTSSFEGFPMLIKESMANGCVPIVTALQGNKNHLTHLKNSLLIQAIEEEAEVVKQGIGLIQQLLDNHDLYGFLSLNAYNYASIKFSKLPFMEYCRKNLFQVS